MRVVGTCLTSLLTLTACLGGGGGSGGGAAAGFAGVNLPLAADPLTFETEEYRRSDGLAAVNASSMYAAGGTGAGVTVGIIDTGIDAAHPEFAGALHPASTDLVRNQPLADGSGHGTAVAGLVGARRNGEATHGLAHNATLLVVRADSADSCPDACLFSQSNLAAGTDYAVAEGADILNFSLGDANGLAASLRQSLRAAADADRVLVFAAGNTSSASPRQPAQFARTAEARGRGIIVGAVDADEVITDFSNRAGNAADVYLVAPGESLRTVADGGGIARVSGTSAATPLVAGAAATLLSAAPHLSGANVVSILLDSARDLGEPGTDAIYGRGMLDLARALQPMGPLRVPEGVSTSDASRPLAASGLDLGAPFGVDVPEVGPVLALDSYDRGYDVGGALVTARAGLPALPGLVARQLAAAPEQLAAGAFALDVTRAGLASGRPLAHGSDITGLAARWQASDRFALRLALGESARQGGAVAVALDETAPETLARHDKTGFRALAASSRIGVDFWPGAGEPAGEGWRLSLDLAGDPGTASGMPAAPDGTGQARSFAAGKLAAIALERRTRERGSWRLGMGRLAEGEGPLGSRAAGVLRSGTATTDFIELAGMLPMGDRLAAFANAQLGRTSLDGGGMIRGGEALWSSAFELGLAAADVVRPADRLGFALLQPLRVEAGSMNLDAPTARDLAGTISRQRRTIGLTPSGRELDLELSYGLDLGGGRLRSALMLRLDPDHDATADPDLLLAIGYRLTF